ncbi:unnamed protein product, partial [Laminaria digitata]
ATCKLEACQAFGKKQQSREWNRPMKCAFVRVFAINTKPTSNSFELKKGQIHSGTIFNVFAANEPPKFHIITTNNLVRRTKKMYQLASWTTANTGYFRNTEERYLVQVCI